MRNAEIRHKPVTKALNFSQGPFKDRSSIYTYLLKLARHSFQLYLSRNFYKQSSVSLCSLPIYPIFLKPNIFKKKYLISKKLEPIINFILHMPVIFRSLSGLLSATLIRSALSHPYLSLFSIKDSPFKPKRGKFFPIHALKAYEGAELQLHAFLT